jgi:hypothetical protein
MDGEPRGEGNEDKAGKRKAMSSMKMVIKMYCVKRKAVISMKRQITSAVAS